MQYADALKRLTLFTRGEPVLVDADLQECLLAHVIPDSEDLDADGVPIAGTEHYDVNGAAAMAWELKAGSTSGDYRISTDGQALDRQQVYAHCMEMHKHYRRRARLGNIKVVRTDVKGG